MLPQVNFEARAVADPELRFAQSGMAIAKIRTVCASRKKLDDGSWVDDKTCWLDVTCFKQMAEHVAESVTKGTLITVSGRLVTEEWETKDDPPQKRSKVAVLADHVGLALAFSPARVMQAERPAPAPADDPWASAPPPPVGGDEPPF